VHVEPGVIYTDMIVLASQGGLLVDESALTGESNPVAKTAVPDTAKATPYHAMTHKKHTVSAGTTVMEAEPELNWAVVYATGSWTSKGELLRNVFGYERHQFKFDAEVGFVIAMLFTYSMFCFALVVSFISEQPVYAWFYGMYV
jgi:magnesium-transporting ATPase (P-type)